MRLLWLAVLFAAAGCTPGTSRGGADAAAGPAGSASSAAPVPDAVEVEGDLLGRIEPLREGGRTLEVTPPDEAEERAFQAWVAATVTVAAGAQAKGGSPPAPPGFALTKIPELGVWLLSEDSRRRGAGAIVLRVGAASPLLVEAPHTFFDQGTLPIAVTFFNVLRARALLVSTAHRYGGKPAPPGDEEEGQGEGGAAGKRRPPPPSDVAHAERSFFLAAHKALLEALPRPLTVQLHGYQDTSAPDVSAILSAAGTGAGLPALLDPLRAALPEDTIRAYPSEIRKLGGESNVQARASFQSGAPFYHIELSRSLRDRLIADAALRRRVATAFPGPRPTTGP
jgi:hypothetical protein